MTGPPILVNSITHFGIVLEIPHLAATCVSTYRGGENGFSAEVTSVFAPSNSSIHRLLHAHDVNICNSTTHPQFAINTQLRLDLVRDS